MERLGCKGSGWTDADVVAFRQAVLDELRHGAGPDGPLPLIVIEEVTL